MCALPVSCLNNEAFTYVCTFTVVNEMCQMCRQFREIRQHCMSWVI